MATVVPSEPLRKESTGLWTTFHSTRACHAQGLERGNCPHTPAAGKLYCYYHDKVQQELLEVEEPGSYPVWPLPNFAHKLRTTSPLAA